MITIVDYGLGNVQAIATIYKRLNIPVSMARDATGLQGARKIVLPGVGAFDWAMTRLNNSGMRDRLDSLVHTGKCDILGICVGMQMLAERSEEGKLPGLGWIPGEIKLFDPCQFTSKTRLPHMGWNDVLPIGEEPVFRNLGESARFYFLHSYYFSPNNSAHITATTDYGGPFACGVRNKNVIGVQFHPEKSHQWGIQLLDNFANS